MAGCLLAAAAFTGTAGGFGTTPARAALLPPYRAAVTAVTTGELGRTWHTGCPVGAGSLRDVRLSYVGFDRRAHQGSIVVAASVVTAVISTFRTLYVARFPIRMMTPESTFAGSDRVSMAHDNTSGFNCRFAVGAPPGTWSVHAYGEAIDVDPVENPYLVNGSADPSEGAPFLRRTPARAGMAEPGGVLVEAFAAVGWKWGGRWAASPDYQHFSATGG